MDGRQWIIRPLPEFAQGWRDTLNIEQMTVATFPPYLALADGIMKYIIGPGNRLDAEQIGNVLLDMRTVTIWPSGGIEQTPSEKKPDLVEFYPEPESQAEAAQTVNQTPAPPSDQTPVRSKKRTGKQAKKKDGIQTAFNHLTQHGDKFSVRELARAAEVTPYAADRAIHDYRNFISQTKTGGLKQ